MLEDMFGGYNPYGQDERLIDPLTIIKNLKCKEIELREKIFVDKPMKNEVSME